VRFPLCLYSLLFMHTLDFPSASLCDCVISTVRKGCPYSRKVSHKKMSRPCHSDLRSPSSNLHHPISIIQSPSSNLHHPISDPGLQHRPPSSSTFISTLHHRRCSPLPLWSWTFRPPSVPVPRHSLNDIEHHRTINVTPNP
jgi:hypothetical protein